MKHGLQVVATAMILSICCTGAPVLAQGFVDAAGLRGAGGFGAGVGAAAGTSKAKQLNSNSASTLKSKLGQSAGNKYLLATQMEKTGKLGEAAALFAAFAAERQQLYGPSDGEILKSYDRAASLATRAGKKAEAEKYMRSALTVCQRTSGVGSPEVKQRMEKLGETPPAVKTPETSAMPTATTAPLERPTETPTVKP